VIPTCVHDTCATEAWYDLLERFLDLVRSGDDRPELWLEIWTLFVDDSWFQETLTTAARRALRNCSRPSGWLEDVEQDAIMILGNKLQQSPDLHVDLRRVDEKFPAWISTIVHNACRQSVRHLRILQRERLVLREEEAHSSRADQLGLHLDVWRAIDALHEPDRTIVQLYMADWNFRRIAHALEMEYFVVYRIWRQALPGLGRMLADYST